MPGDRATNCDVEEDQIRSVATATPVEVSHLGDQFVAGIESAQPPIPSLGRPGRAVGHRVVVTGFRSDQGRFGERMLAMREVRYTDIEVANPSTPRQRQDAAQRHADAEVGDDEEAISVRVEDTGTRVGDDSRLWWHVTYEVIPKRRS